MKHFTFCLLILALIMITTGLTQKVWDWKPNPMIFMRCTPSGKNVTIAMHATDLTNEELIQMYDSSICQKVSKPKSKYPKPTRRPTKPLKTNTTAAKH